MYQVFLIQFTCFFNNNIQYNVQFKCHNWFKNSSSRSDLLPYHRLLVMIIIRLSVLPESRINKYCCFHQRELYSELLTVIDLKIQLYFDLINRISCQLFLILRLICRAHTHDTILLIPEIPEMVKTVVKRIFRRNWETPYLFARQVKDATGCRVQRQAVVHAPRSSEEAITQRLILIHVVEFSMTCIHNLLWTLLPSPVRLAALVTRGTSGLGDSSRDVGTLTRITRCHGDARSAHALDALIWRIKE